MKPYVGINQPLMTARMLKKAEQLFPDMWWEETARGEIVIHTNTFSTGDEDYYKRRRAA